MSILQDIREKRERRRLERIEYHRRHHGPPVLNRREFEQLKEEIYSTNRRLQDTNDLQAEEQKSTAAEKCCLIAKQRNERGCIALKTERDKAIAALVSYLGSRTAGKGIEVLTVSDPEAYGEYKPYEFVPSEDEFISRMFAMMEQTYQKQETEPEENEFTNQCNTK